MLKEARFAHVWMNAEFICVETYSGRGLMARDPDGMREFHELDSSDASLGSSLQAALDSSRWISMEEYPSYFDLVRRKLVDQSWAEDVMARYGYRTRKAIFKNMMSCSVSSQDDVVTIKPSFHEKLEGWSGKGITASDHVVLASSDSADVIGAGVRLALSRCR